ncbi:M24 family metallopeptidase [Pelagovum pacificum]|uniref:M24 family metallopeptidase n=1 Tax=Pelagovum pacificum TaxID=2588711 RepID=A0A5C5GBD4_9RHOB|nr:M24 family metallopeptidase [Pelagovum pacificum]QQA44767.1 M24 family metallopeptidase [Pelagovum pacificum]TNY32125.1 M24 family metallopeptidase [Pelagovum pacificum]
MPSSRTSPSFPDSEYWDRIEKTRAAMEAEGLDAILITDPSNMAWISGYDGWSFYVHQAVLLSHEGEPVWWGRGMDAAGAMRTVFMEEDNIFGYEDFYVQNPDKHPMEDLARLVEAYGHGEQRIGVELDNYYFSAKAYQTLLKSMPKAEFVDCTGLVNWQRSIKSDTELIYMRRAADIVTAMHAKIAELAEPGMPKHRLVAEIYHTGISGVGGHWGDYPAIVPMAPSGLDATAPHLTWDDTPLRTGEATFFEIAGAHRRYHCPQSRTLFLGKPPQKYIDAEKAVEDATEAALEQAKPGNRCEDIARAFNERLATHGFIKDNRCGYSIGLSYPPDWGERTMSFRAGDRTELLPGMTFHFMPALWLDDGGIETTEPILITETGHDRLCGTPSGLVVKS